MRPADPTTTPVEGEMNDTAVSVYAVEFDTCGDHVVPVFVVWRIVPRSPTAQPSLRVMNHPAGSVRAVDAAALWSTQPRPCSTASGTVAETMPPPSARTSTSP